MPRECHRRPIPNFVPESAEMITVQKPYTLTVTDKTITVSCSGEVVVFDMNGRCLALEADKMVFVGQTDFYILRIVVDGKTYVERISTK